MVHRRRQLVVSRLRRPHVRFELGRRRRSRGEPRPPRVLMGGKRTNRLRVRRVWPVRVFAGCPVTRRNPSSSPPQPGRAASVFTGGRVNNNGGEGALWETGGRSRPPVRHVATSPNRQPFRQAAPEHCRATVNRSEARTVRTRQPPQPQRQEPPARLGLEPCTVPVRVPGPPAEPSTVRALTGCGNNTKPGTVVSVRPTVDIRERGTPKKKSVGWLVGWLVGWSETRRPVFSVYSTVPPRARRRAC